MRTIRYVLLFCCIAASSSCFCQNYGYLDVRSGFDQFVLGAVKPDFDTTIKPVKSWQADSSNAFTWKGKTVYYYSYPGCFNKPFELANISFVNLLLTFNQTDTLFRILLSPKPYSRKNDSAFAAKAQADFVRLYELLNARWDKKGKKEVIRLNRDMKGTRYIWKGKKSSMELRLNEDLMHGNSFVEIQLELNQ